MSGRSSSSSAGVERGGRAAGALAPVAGALVAVLVLTLARPGFSNGQDARDARRVEVPAAPPAGGAAAIARLAFLAGCWERRSGARLVEEQWMAPRGGMMLGMSRTVRGDTLVEFEQLRVYQRDGRLVFAAAPSGQEPSEFVSVGVTDSSVVFENPAHDFPHRVLYRLVGSDSLHARIEGAVRGKARSVDFPYRRTRCP